MKKQQIIHIKLDSDEAVDSRKDVLSTEFDLIQIAQAIKRYRILRLKELQLKITLYNQTKKFREDMNQLRTLLPKLEIPKILKKHEEEMHAQVVVKDLSKIKKQEKKPKQAIKAKEEKSKEDPLEKQLREIQDKLNSLE